MSRWIDDFKNHSFQITWEEVTTLLKTIPVPEGASRPNIMELSRLKKIIKYIDELLTAVDPELVPPAVWTNIEAQNPSILSDLNNFLADKNFQHLNNANSRSDNILGYISPHVKPGKGAAQAAGRAFKEYSDTVEEYISFLKSDSDSTINDIVEQKKNIDTSIVEINASKSNIQNLEHLLLIDGEKETSLQSRLKELETEAVEWHSKISSFHQQLTSGSEEEAAIILQIEEARKRSIKDTADIENALKSTQNAIAKLTNFHEYVIGETLEGQKTKDGLKDKLQKRNEELDDFEEIQKNRYSELFKQIESLISGATNVGLATAFNDQKKSYSQPIQNSNRLFFCICCSIINCRTNNPL